MEKTKWYPGDISPVHKGIYETSMSGATTFFDEWDGKCWRNKYGNELCKSSVLKWRGMKLMEEPKC